VVNYACTVINIVQTEKKPRPIFSDTGHSFFVRGWITPKKVRVARLAHEAGTSNMYINQSFKEVSR
jgi:hypothetical protein